MRASSRWPRWGSARPISITSRSMPGCCRSWCGGRCASVSSRRRTGGCASAPGRWRSTASSGSATRCGACAARSRRSPRRTRRCCCSGTGTGKELLARAVHRLSGRSHKPFVAINCAAIPETLLESELFGYEKGAFTGAAKRTAGKLESAEGGTVFLDEIGEMPPSLQAKLLRVVQERTVERVGGRVPASLNSRLVCATNRNLDTLIGNGSFRDDLFYRISEVSIRVPPLRDRQGDSLLLAQFLLQQ